MKRADRNRAGKKIRNQKIILLPHMKVTDVKEQAADAGETTTSCRAAIKEEINIEERNIRHVPGVTKEQHPQNA